MSEFTNDAEAKLFVIQAYRLGSGLTDFIGMVEAGGRGSKPKGMFSRTTYDDRLENETEYGYVDTANRIQRNIARNSEV